MQMNMDFCFVDDHRVLAVTGWTTEARPLLRVHVDDVVLTPVRVARHVRRDLRSSEPLGVIALFSLSGLPEGVDIAKATIHLAEGNHFNEIRNDRLREDARRLVEVGVDEVFFAMLRLVAQRHLVLSDQDSGREICARLRAAPSAARETENHVLGVDRCQMTEQGQGVVIGWFMPASASAEPLCALVVEDEMVAPVELLPGSMSRADLSGYASRYRFTGRDGYGGGWHFPSRPSGPARLLLMVPGEHFLPGVLVPVEAAEPADLAQNVTVASLGIEDIADRARLRSALLPNALSHSQPQEPAGVENETSGETLLILDHDLADTDLRDVLRRIGPHLPGRLRLHLLRPRLNVALRNGIDGASREITAGLELEGASLGITRPAIMPGRVVFARSASLFQFDPEVLFAPDQSDAQVMLLDPIGTVLGSPAAEVERFARDLLPFALSMRGADFFNLLDHIPHCFLTEEARLRLLAEALMTAGDAQMHRADIYRYFEGKSGPHCQNFADGRDWHAYDAESRHLIERAELA